MDVKARGRAHITEAALILEVTPPTVYSRIYEGKIKAYRINGKYKIAAEELARLVPHLFKGYTDGTY